MTMQISVNILFFQFWVKWSEGKSVAYDAVDLWQRTSSLDHFIVFMQILCIVVIAIARLLCRIYNILIMYNNVTQSSLIYKIKHSLISTNYTSKSRCFPCHYWYPFTIEIARWINCLILSTWQQLATLSQHKAQIHLLTKCYDWLMTIMKCLLHSMWTWLWCRAVKPALGHLISTVNKPLIAASFFVRQLPCACRPSAELDNELHTTGQSERHFSVRSL